MAANRRILHETRLGGGVRMFKEGVTFRIAKDEIGVCRRVFS